MSGTVLPFPFERTIGTLPNDARMEWLYAALEAHPDVTKKRLILQARSPEVGFLDDQQATVMIASLGLGDA